MVFWEFVGSLLALDFTAMASLVLDNLFFLFAFLCVAYFIYEKRAVFYFFVVVGLVWITGELSVLVGWTAAFVPIIFWVGRGVVHSFSGIRFVSKNMTLAMTLTYYISWSALNILEGNEFVLPWNDLPVLTILTLLAVATIHFIDIKSSDGQGILNRKAMPST